MLLTLVPLLAKAQVMKLGAFDQKPVHYGIQLGLTQSKFDLHYTDSLYLRDTIQGVSSYYAPGFHISVIADIRLGHFFSFRFLPGVMLVNRDIHYHWESYYQASHVLAENKRSVESVYGELPIELKFRALRDKNFRPYFTAGASYGFDFASLRKNKNNSEESIIRLEAEDLRYTTGIGFDFFLRYVKFAIELKALFGMKDLRIYDNDIYTRCTDSMKSRTFMLSITFEG